MRERMQGPGIHDSYPNRIIGFTVLDGRMSIPVGTEPSTHQLGPNVPCSVLEYVREIL